MHTLVKLIDSDKQNLCHGNILRLPGMWPYEKLVDFMVFDTQDDEQPNGLIITTGHKAGLILLLLPPESCAVGTKMLDKQWVINNWSKWIYPECKIEDVHLLENYTI
jgi:hypothetical protein